MGPDCSMANLESRLREMKGSREIMGSIMEETREFAQAVKEAARLVAWISTLEVYVFLQERGTLILQLLRARCRVGRSC